MLSLLKKYIYISCWCFKIQLKLRRTSYSFNDSKRETKCQGQWHYLAVKKLPALLTRITSKHRSHFYCLNCFYSFATEKQIELYKKVCENKKFSNSVMPSEDTKTLEFNQHQKPDKAPFIISAEFECLIEKIDWCKNNPQNLFTTKVSEQISSDFSMSTTSLFTSIENKHDA